MKLTDMLISMIIKRGVMYEARSVEANLELPSNPELKIKLKADRVIVTILKEENEV